MEGLPRHSMPQGPSVGNPKMQMVIPVVRMHDYAEQMLTEHLIRPR